MNKFIVVQKVSIFTLIRRWLANTGAMIVYKLYNRYRLTNVDFYDFHGSRLTQELIEKANFYVDEGAIFFYKEEMHRKVITRLSQYYPYAKIEEKKEGEVNLRICNVGCFYAGADAHFLRKHPGSMVYGLDFGKNLLEINKDLDSPNLKLFQGYPLEVLEQCYKDKEFQVFDYTLFIRTAVKINIEQLMSYMEVIGKLSKNICFLEVAKLAESHQRSVDISRIDIMNPMKLYGGMYLHNYPKILETFGYEIISSEILPASTFPEQNLTPDHNFFYIHGRKKF
jgi:hypothetical protein